MAKPGKIVLDHEDGLSSLATWWKAFFLMPIWGFLVILPLGVFIRVYLPAFGSAGFFLIIAAGCVYFARDMAKRRIAVSDKEIQFGMQRELMAELQSVKVKKFLAPHITTLLPASLYKRPRITTMMPKSLLLTFSSGQTMELMLSRLDDGALSLLIDTISRRVSHCTIDPDVEEILRRRKPKAVLRLEDPNKLDVVYNDKHVLEELPAVLRKTVRIWSRVVGPVGTVLLCSPLWLTVAFLSYNFLRDFSNVKENLDFYYALTKIITFLYVGASSALQAGQQLTVLMSRMPVVTFLCIVATLYMLSVIVRRLLGANRLTVTASEISLDRFFNLFSYTSDSIAWKDIEKITLFQPKGTADPNQAEIRFEDDSRLSPMIIKMAALSSRDREKLSLAVSNLAAESYVDSHLTEALSSSADKSYTELWLKSLSDAPGRKNLEPLAAGHLLENCRYEIEKKLAVGGEGVAYLGRDLKEVSSGRVDAVVLKETLIPPFVDKQVQQRSLERFEREARLLKELKSEYVVGLRDYFIEDHRCYLVLDFVEGKNLRQYVAEHGALSEDKVLDLTRQMCSMLQFLHGRQVIHRDFTPDNLILQDNGKLKLIDFNVARESDEGKTGTIVGKHAYVPPEQFRGKPTEQSDIYALGATLQYLLTGEDPEPITQSSPIKKNATVSPSMDQLVKDCTALDTAKRLKSIEDILTRCEGTEATPESLTIKIELDLDLELTKAEAHADG